MERFIEAFILVLVLEGILFALFPNKVREAMLKVLSMSDWQIRTLGGTALISAIILGVFLKLMK